MMARHSRESQLLKKEKKREKEMKTVKRINVDLNLNSDSLGRERKRSLCFSFDAFLLEWRTLLCGLFLSVGTGKSLELTWSLAFLRHLTVVCP